MKVGSIGVIRTIALLGLLAWGSAVAATHAPVSASIPGPCHWEPYLCDEWTGAGCDAPCVLGESYICCAP